MMGTAAGLPQVQSVLSHARARLLVGMVAVGAVVCICLIALAGLSLTSTGHIENRSDLPAIAILLGYLCYLCLQSSADVCGGVVIPLVFQRRRESVLKLVSCLGFGVVRHGAIQLVLFGVLILGSALFGRVGLLIAGLSNAAILLFFQSMLSQFVSGSRIEKAEKSNVVIVHGLDGGFTGAVVDTLGGATLMLPYSANDQDRRYKTVRLTAVRELQSSSTRLFLPIFTNSIGAVLALYYLSNYPVLPVRDALVFALCATLWSFVLLLVLPVLNRQAVMALDRELIKTGLDSAEFERAIRSEDLKGEDEYSRSRLVQSVFYPIPAPDNRIRNVTGAKHLSQFWIAFHNIARRTLYCSLGFGGFLSRSVHCNVGRPELWIVSPSD